MVSSRPIFAAAGLLLADAALSDGVPLPGSGAWRPVEFSRIEEHTRYEAEQIDRGAVWHATSECSASGLAVTLDDLDLARTPLLSWSWRVAGALAPKDERARGGDDFAARVYVVFPFEPEGSSRWQRILRRMAQGLYREALPGFTLSYVWASESVPGTFWASPHSDAAWMIALRSGAASDSAWLSETVDVASDLARLPKPPKLAPVALAVMTDSDDTCGRTEAWYRDFRFHARPAETENAHPTRDPKDPASASGAERLRERNTSP